MTGRMILASLLCLVAAGVARAADGARRTVVYDRIATEVVSAPGESNDLWVTLSDLTRATKFVLKPQGVCRDQLCFPIPKARKTEFLRKQSSKTWFNLTEFARLIKQPVAADDKNGVWYFGVRAEDAGGYLASLEAPGFTLPDVNGRMHSLSDYRGKKVLLLTWASW
jgi:hypothetical protein